MAQRNFGFEAKRDEQDRIQFWTGFIAGAITSAISFIGIVLLLIWKYPA